MGNEGNLRTGITQPPPPLTYLVSLVLGVIANFYYQIPISSSGTIPLLILGLGISVIGMALGLFALRAMRRSSVSPLPWQSPPKLVVDGPFRFSRNPLYLTTTIIYLAITIALNTLWPLTFLIFALIIMDRRVIPDEEIFLEKKFGDEYRSYKARVRRWI